MPKAAEADAVNIANGYALATNRASMIAHVYIETTFYSLHGKQISLEEYNKLPEKKLKEVEHPILYHQIPVLGFSEKVSDISAFQDGSIFTWNILDEG